MTINDILLYRTYEIPTKNRGKQGKKDKSLFKGNRRGCKHNKGGKHMSRKTFASTVLLYNDVPIEIVSELLGHSNMGIVIAGILISKEFTVSFMIILLFHGDDHKKKKVISRSQLEK